MTSTFTTELPADTPAKFNAWCSQVSAQFSKFGWQKTADAGQADWATNATVPNTFDVVYELWQMTDELATQFPVIVKVSYFCINTYSSAAPMTLMTLQIGSATDGNGNFPGFSTPRLQCYSMAQAMVAAKRNSFACGDQSRIWVMTDYQLQSSLATSDHCKFFAIERSRDADGNCTPDYVTIITAGQNGSGINNYFPNHTQTSFSRLLGAMPVEDKWTAPFPYSSRSATFGGTGGVVPIFPWVDGPGNPLMSVAGGKRLDFQDMTGVRAVSYGYERTYRVFSASVYCCMFPFIHRTDGVNGGVNGNCAILALWE